MLKTTSKILALVMLLLPAAAWAESWKGVPLIDTLCAPKFEGRLDEHTTSCALQCAKGGYGIVVEGKFLQFDAKGNELALAALKETKKKAALRVTVEGTAEAGTLRVAKLAID